MYKHKQTLKKNKLEEQKNEKGKVANMQEELKSVRAKLNLTQQDLADLLNIPKRTLENWECGQRKVTSWNKRLILSEIKRIEKIAEAEGVEQLTTILQQIRNGEINLNDYGSIEEIKNKKMQKNY